MERWILLIVMIVLCSACSEQGKSERKFYAALKRDDVTEMKKHIADVDLNKRGPDGRVYIHSAVIHGSVKAASYLWGQEPQLTKVERYELLLFTMQAQQKKLFVKFLKKRSVREATNRDGKSILLSAVELHRGEYVDLWLQHGGNPHLTNRSGETFAHVVAQYATIREVNRWSKYIDDWNVRMDNGDTPFMSAVRQQNKRLLPILIKLGAKPTIANDKGETALHIAVQYNDPQLVEQLLKQKWRLSNEAKTKLFQLATISGGATLKQQLLKHRQSL